MKGRGSAGWAVRPTGHPALLTVSIVPAEGQRRLALEHRRPRLPDVRSYLCTARERGQSAMVVPHDLSKGQPWGPAVGANL